MTRTLNSGGQLTLMMRAGTGYTAGQNLSALRNKAAQLGDVLIVDGINLINAEAANLLASFAATTGYPAPAVRFFQPW